MRYYLLICFFLSFSSLCLAQTQSDKLTKYTIENGLSHNQISWVFQDSRDVIWVGAINGVNRFDGTEFKMVAKNDFFEFTCAKIHEDLSGDLWIESQSRRNIFIFNIYTQKFKSIQEKFGSNYPFLNSPISSAATLPDGTLVISHKNKHLVYYDPIHKKVLDKIKTNFIPSAIFSNQQDNSIWVYEKEPLNKNYTPENSSTNIFFVNTDKSIKKITTLPWYTAFDIGVTSENELIVSHGENLIYINPNAKVDEYGCYNIDGIEPFFYSYITSEIIYSANRKQFWFVDKGNVITSQSRSGTSNQYLIKNKLLDVSALHYSFLKDDFLWIASIDGLFKINIAPSLFQKAFYQDPIKTPQADLHSCRGICADGDNNIYVNSHTLYKLNENEMPANPYVRRLAILYENDNIWSGSYNSLYKYNLQTKQSKIYKFSDKGAKTVWSLYMDINQRLWIGTSGALMYLDEGSDEIKFFKNFNGFHSHHNSIVKYYSVFTDQSNQIWLVTSQGLYTFDIKEGITGGYSSEFSEDNYLPALDFRHMHQDKKGIFWIACKEGLLRWDKNKEETKFFSSTEGFPAAQLYAVYEDDFGFLWLSSDNGLIQFEKSSHRFRIFFPEDGITNREFNRISHYQASDGSIYFGGLNGVTYFHPKDFQHSFDHQPDINLLLLECNLLSSKTNKRESRLATLNNSEKITMAPGDKSLYFKFALLDYENPQQIQYAYIIDPTDIDDESAWHIIKENTINIDYLPFGHHRIIIKGKTANGHYSSNILKIPIVVNKPFYLKTWFLLFLLLSLILAFYFYQKIKTKNLIIRQKKLEQTVKERTKIILSQKEELQALDKAKTRFLANISHEFKTPLTIILNSLNSENAVNIQELTRLKELIHFYKKDIQIVRKNAGRLQGLIQQLLELTQLESGKLKLKASKQNISYYLKELTDSFLPLARNKNIELTFSSEASELEIYFDRDKVDRIFYNLLANAIKFTPKKGKIIIKIKQNQSLLFITIKDTGIGIPKEDFNKIFNRFYQVKRSDEYAYEGTGLGLAIVKDFVELHQGTIDVESHMDKGTLFRIALPVNSDHLKPEEIVAITQTQSSIFKFNAEEELDRKFLERKTILASGDKPVLLIVEDNEDLLYHQQRQFQGDYQILTARDGIKGVELALEHIPDLILSDIMMPGKDGYNLCHQLKSNQVTDHIPVILLTAKSTQDEKIKGLSMGADDYILKPYDQKELALRLANQLEQIRNIQKKFKAESINHTAPQPVQNQFVKRIINSIDDNISNSFFGVEELAKELKLSRSQLFRKLKAISGVTPTIFIRTYRLKKARQLLEQFKGNAAEVSHMVGFSSPNYFYKCFKTEFGITPSELMNSTRPISPEVK